MEDCLLSPSIQRLWNLTGNITETIIIHRAKLGVVRYTWYSQVPWEGDDLRGEAFEEGQVCPQAPGEPMFCKAEACTVKSL